MATSYTSYESFLRSATGGEKDALNAFNRLDALCPSEVLAKKDDLRYGAEVSARLNAGYAGQTSAELAVENLAAVKSAVEYAIESEAEGAL
jgi:hypothetical protein